MYFGHGFDSRLVHFTRPCSNTSRKFGQVDGTGVVIRTVVGDNNPILIHKYLIYKGIREMLSECFVAYISTTELVKPVIKMIRSKAQALKLSL